MTERKKLKVLITSSSYLPNIGGIENSLYYLAKAGENDDVTIVASDNIVHVEDKDERPDFNCKIIRYHLPHNKNPILRVFFNWKNAFATYRKVKKEGCDLGLIVVRPLLLILPSLLFLNRTRTPN
ncbi:MAG: hypothetical protein IBX55_22865 [Methyloprofundus sp.]|nr:hypothetical protein [Methyloprofundus sp.]